MAVIQSNMYDDDKFLIMDTLDISIAGDDKGNTLEMAMLIAEQYIVFCQPEEDVIVVSQLMDGEMKYLVQLDKIAEGCNLIMEDGQEFLEYLNAVSIDLW